MNYLYIRNCQMTLDMEISQKLKVHRAEFTISGLYGMEKLAITGKVTKLILSSLKLTVLDLKTVVQSMHVACLSAPSLFNEPFSLSLNSLSMGKCFVDEISNIKSLESITHRYGYNTVTRITSLPELETIALVRFV
jgi:hypothetical protein